MSKKYTIQVVGHGSEIVQAKYTDEEIKILAKEYEIPPFFLDTVTDPTDLENVVAFDTEEDEDEKEDIDVNDI